MNTILHGLLRHTVSLLLCRNIVPTLPHNKAFVTLVVVVAGIVFYPNLLLSSVLFLTGLAVLNLSPRGVRYVYGLTLMLSGVSAIESVALMLGAPKAIYLFTLLWLCIAGAFFWRHIFWTESNE